MSLLENSWANTGLPATRGGTPVPGEPPAIPRQREAADGPPGSLEPAAVLPAITLSVAPSLVIPPPAHAAPPPGQAAERRYLRRLRGADAVAGLVAGLVTFLTASQGSLGPEAAMAGVSIALLWPASVTVMRGYEPRCLHTGLEEYRRVLVAAALTVLAGGFAALALQLPVTAVEVLVPAAVAGLLSAAFRQLSRLRLRRQRRAGRGWTRKVLVVGHEQELGRVLRDLRADPAHGFEVAGLCVFDEEPAAAYDVPVAHSPADVARLSAHVGADTVMLLPCLHLGAATVRRLAWQLERSATQVLIAPALIDVAHHRVTVGQVSSLAVVNVEHAELTGAQRALKEVFDRTFAAAALLAIAPVLAVLMVAVRLESPGPVVFRQERVGRDNRLFTLLKLRTMVTDAEDRRQDLLAQNEANGVLFKIRQDPRVTRVGRFLRRYSLDELPQLVNVLLGHMSLVGPRPALPDEVALYEHDTRRRLAVKPGITGLWQVSGRSNLSWEEAVRLDLRYVENWTLATDLAILARTGRAVLSHEGAY
jgi:exopolysaccharide biosynthesis polyprenyl glycosylphosphotransferase